MQLPNKMQCSILYISIQTYYVIDILMGQIFIYTFEYQPLNMFFKRKTTTSRCIFLYLHNMPENTSIRKKHQEVANIHT
jgi:hypothetical protein